MTYRITPEISANTILEKDTLIMQGFITAFLLPRCSNDSRTGVTCYQNKPTSSETHFH